MIGGMALPSFLPSEPLLVVIVVVRATVGDRNKRMSV